MEKYTWGKYIEYSKTFQINHVYEFISWFRDKCYKLALINLKKLFGETTLDETELEDNFELEATFFELNFFIKEVKPGKFKITNKNLEKAGERFTNHLFNKFLFNLSELNIVDLYYDAKKDSFFWKHKYYYESER